MKAKIIVGWVALVSIGFAEAAVWHVDASAKGPGDGSAARPWPGVQQALDGIRAARKAGTVGPGEPVEILLAPGDYWVGSGLRLTAADSGTAGAPVVWRPAAEGAVRLLGGVRVPASRFRKVESADVLARLPAEARGKVFVADVSDLCPREVPALADAFGGRPAAPMLFVGHRLGTLARWPNADYTAFSQAVDWGGVLRTRPDGGTVRSPGAFVYSDPRAKRWDFAAGVWMNGYWTHDWDNHSVRAAAYGTENGTNDVIRLAANIPYGIMGGTWGRKSRRFYVFNLLEELDSPGEWYLDRTRKLLYLQPPHGVPADADEMVLAFSPEPVLRAKDVAFVRFEGLVFAYGYGSGVAATGHDLVFANCRIANFGGSGLSLGGNRNAVRNVEVCNIGLSGISVWGGDRRTLTKAETRIEDCHVHDWAIYQRTYAPAIGVQGCGITLRRNRMHDAPHSAVLYGGNEHLFEYNEVYRVLMETGDAGAYYTGRDWTTMGNVLRYNHTHDLGAEGDHANTMGFYFDDCDCGDAVYGNVFHNVARGIMVGGGREHPIRNNVFSRCKIGLSIDCRGMTWKHWNSREHGGESWMLEEKAKKLDYTNGVWAAAYPRLARIMQDHPREPLYNPVENNVFIDCEREILALDRKADACWERLAPIAGNLVINTRGTNGVKTAKVDARLLAGFRVVNGTPDKPFDAGFVDAARGNFALRPDAWLRREMPAFEPLKTAAGE
ncbi:MAG: right-handed parallel beta-helix repeat-containing protein [Kiritimatiellia bacterium]